MSHTVAAKTAAIIDKVVSFGLIASFFILIFLSSLNVFFRWFQLSYSWIDPLLRHLVFLMIFLGGVLACAKGSHITIDILNQWSFYKKIKRPMDRLLMLISIFVLGVMIYGSIEMVKTEIEYGKIVFLGIHSSVLVGIIPFGFFLMGLRWFLEFVQILPAPTPTPTQTMKNKKDKKK